MRELHEIKNGKLHNNFSHLFDLKKRRKKITFSTCSIVMKRILEY